MAWQISGMRTWGAATAMFFVVHAHAEKLWVQPERPKASLGATVSFEICQGDNFDSSPKAVKPDRVIALDGTLGEQPTFLMALSFNGKVSRFSGTFSRPGVAAVSVELKPETRSIPREAVENYLRALHASDEVREAWDRIEAPNPWREIVTRRLKTYVRIGEPPAGEHGWTKTSPAGLDVVPVSDPTAQRSTMPFVVRVTRDGKEASGVIVEFLSLGEEREHVSVTRDDGTASAPLNSVGLWLVRCFDIKRANAADHDWETEIVAMVVTARE